MITLVLVRHAMKSLYHEQVTLDWIIISVRSSNFKLLNKIFFVCVCFSTCFEFHLEVSLDFNTIMCDKLELLQFKLNCLKRIV